jgi:hypothetical protein
MVLYLNDPSLGLVELLVSLAYPVGGVLLLALSGAATAVTDGIYLVARPCWSSSGSGAATSRWPPSPAPGRRCSCWS